MSSSVAAFCNRCGAANRLGKAYCPACGNPMRLAPPAAGGPAAVPSPTYQPTGYPPSSGWGAPPPGYPYAPLVPPVKRLNVRTVFEDALQLFFRDFRVYVGLSAVIGIAAGALTLLLTTLIFGAPVGLTPYSPGYQMSMDLGALYRYLVPAILAAVMVLLIQVIIIGTLIYFAFQRYHGAKVTFREAIAQGKRRFLSVLGASLGSALIVLCLLAVPLGILLAGLAKLDFLLVAVALLLVLGLLPILIYISIGLSLYAPAVVIEEKTAVASLRRSWELARGRRTVLFAALLLVGLVSGALSAMITLPFVLSSNAYLYAVGSAISTAITGSWTLISSAVAYSLIVSPPPVGGLGTPYPAPRKKAS